MPFRLPDPVQTLQKVDHGQPKRILSLDGGGLRVFFTLEVLERVEQLVRQRLGRDEAVLADHFDLIAGTSTGAILGALLAWGKSIAWVKSLYKEVAVKVFRPYRNPLQWWRHRYNANALSDMLRDFFVEDGPQGRQVRGAERPLVARALLAGVGQPAPAPAGAAAQPQGGFGLAFQRKEAFIGLVEQAGRPAVLVSEQGQVVAHDWGRGQGVGVKEPGG